MERKKSIPKSRALKAITKARLLYLLLITFGTCEMQAQFFPYNPYNPYMNPNYQAGQQLGNAIKQRSKYGRNQLRKAIKKWGECNNGTLSLEHGAVALYGSNGYLTYSSFCRLKPHSKSDKHRCSEQSSYLER